MTTFSHTAIKLALRALAIGGVALASATSMAATESGNLTVTATIANQCAVGDAALALGAMTLVAADGTMATPSGGSTIGVPWACTNGTAATLSFDVGANSTGSDRRMKSTTAGASNQFFEYQLKADSSSGAAIGTTGLPLAGTGTDGTFTVWGGPVDSLANKAAKPASDYTDTVQMTITFTP
jgi:spore coat protein U-like protein